MTLIFLFTCFVTYLNRFFFLVKIKNYFNTLDVKLPKKKKRRAYWHLKLRERERGGVGTNETALKLTAVIIAGSMVSLYGKAQHTCIYKQHRIHGAALFPI